MTDRQIALAVLLATVLDATVMPLCAVAGFRPVLWVTVVSYAALTRRAGVGMTAGLCGGLLVDALSPASFGAHAAGGIVVGFLTGHVWRAVYRDRWPAQAACLFVGVLVCDAVAAWVAGHASVLSVAGLISRQSLPAAAATALAGPPLAAWLAHVLHWQIRWEHATGAR